MVSTTYSFGTAILFFSLSVLICDILRRKDAFIVHYNINVLLWIVSISVLRLCIPLEVPATYVVNSFNILAAVQRFFRAEIPIFGASLSIATLLLCIYIIGSVVCLLRLIIRIRHDKKLVQSLDLYSIEDDRVSNCMEKISAKSKQNFRIIISDKVVSAMATGLFTPIILLPQTAVEMNDAELHNVLAHEWHHVIKKDLFIKSFIELIICIMWWNPVVYMLKGGFDQVLEIKCDIGVTKKMTEKEKLGYLKVLLSAAQNSPETTRTNSPQLFYSNFGHATSNGDALIKQRFVAVRNSNTHKPIRTAILILVMIISFALSFLIVFQPASDPPIKEILMVTEITPESVYILVRNDGTHALVSQECTYEVSEGELSRMDHRSLKKIYE